MRDVKNKKSKYIHNNIKCEQIKQSNQRAKIVRLNKKQDPTICSLWETHIRNKWTESKDMEKIHNANRNKKARLALPQNRL